nr:FAD-binding protein [Jiangella mangrovi]
MRPGSAGDVAAVVRWAAAQGVPVVARGEGHSVYGRSQVDGGIVVDMRPLGAVSPPEQGRIAVGAGATWRSVLAATLPAGSPRRCCRTTSTSPSAALSPSAGLAARRTGTAW